eukprot:TRINITY_DN254_c0_g1_i1.p1 TRINITY_DN254_c0_g1~~TRINITY_DN254_c0_g1_i1.p1  ORF type:complete len:180 (-),score=52.33 TRINITY_DN254_c0_g1_i1:505-1044(-)
MSWSWSSNFSSNSSSNSSTNYYSNYQEKFPTIEIYFYFPNQILKEKNIQLGIAFEDPAENDSYSSSSSSNYGYSNYGNYGFSMQTIRYSWRKCIFLKQWKPRDHSNNGFETSENIWYAILNFQYSSIRSQPAKFKFLFIPNSIQPNSKSYLIQDFERNNQTIDSFNVWLPNLFSEKNSF